MQQTDHVVDAMLSDFAIGDCCCIVEPQTDSFNYTLAYLLLWIEALELFSSLIDEMRSEYASFLRQSNFLSRLLENLFRLMPVSHNDYEAQDFCKLFSDQREFCNHPNLSLDANLDSSDIQKLSCYVYYLVLRKLPASVRQWWNNLDKRTSDIVNK